MWYKLKKCGKYWQLYGMLLSDIHAVPYQLTMAADGTTSIDTRYAHGLCMHCVSDKQLWERQLGVFSSKKYVTNLVNKGNQNKANILAVSNMDKKVVSFF